MSLAKVENITVPLPSQINLRSLISVLAYAAFAVLLIAVLLTQITDPPEIITGWRIAIGFVFVAVLAAGIHWYREDEEHDIFAFLIFLAGSFLLLELVYRSSSPGIRFGWNRSYELLFVFLLLFTVATVYPDLKRFDPAQWVFIAMVAIVVGLFFYHTLAAPPELVGARWPIWAGIITTFGLLVIPRYIPERVFLWTLAILASLAAIAGLLTVSWGEYSVLIFEVTSHESAIKMIEYEGIHATPSVFNNLNVFGLVTFAGLIAATILLHRRIQTQQHLLAGIAALLTFTIGLGLLSSLSEASWIAAGLAMGIYLPYAAFGRRAIPVAVVGATVLFITALLAAYYGWIPVSDGGRFGRWIPSANAFLDNPSLFGHGHVSTQEFTGELPHNSYISIFIRLGIVGGIAYLLLLLGGITYGTIKFHTVNVGMLAMTFGWAVHHQFEEYTMLQWTIPAVLSTLALGYLLFGDRGEPNTKQPDDPPEPLRSRAKDAIDRLQARLD